MRSSREKSEIKEVRNAFLGRKKAKNSEKRYDFAKNVGGSGRGRADGGGGGEGGEAGPRVLGVQERGRLQRRQPLHLLQHRAGPFILRAFSCLFSHFCRSCRIARGITPSVALAPILRPRLAPLVLAAYAL